jgi:hypothetical protein
MFSGWGVDSLLAIVVNQKLVTKVQQDLKLGQGSTCDTEDRSNDSMTCADENLHQGSKLEARD